LGEEALDTVSLVLVSGLQVVEEHAVVAGERSHVAHTDSFVVEALEGRGYQPADDSTPQRLLVLAGQGLGEAVEDGDPTEEQLVHE
jgi:hypothetical protein